MSWQAGASESRSRQLLPTTPSGACARTGDSRSLLNKRQTPLALPAGLRLGDRHQRRRERGCTRARGTRDALPRRVRCGAIRGPSQSRSRDMGERVDDSWRQTVWRRSPSRLATRRGEPDVVLNDVPTRQFSAPFGRGLRVTGRATADVKDALVPDVSPRGAVTSVVCRARRRDRVEPARAPVARCWAA
jgi:hypothetical protein